MLKDMAKIFCPSQPIKHTIQSHHFLDQKNKFLRYFSLALSAACHTYTDVYCKRNNKKGKGLVCDPYDTKEKSRVRVEISSKRNISSNP